MWRLFFLGLIVWLVVYMFKRNVGQSGTTRTNGEKTVGDHDIESEGKIENMVKCDTCAVHLPRSEAFLVNGKFYCCQAHIQNK